MNTLKYQYWFLSNKDVPFTRKCKVAQYFTDSYHIFYADKKDLIYSGLFTEQEAELFVSNRDKVNLDSLYESFTQGPYSFITLEDDNYPNNLKNIFDPPYGFYYIGKLLSFEKSVSIVGARNCSAYGKKMALELGERLGAAGYTVISGLARGIDSFAHRGCLNGNGKTAAVLGCGVDVVYPKENRLLYEEVAEKGMIISEYPISFQPKPENFPMRNRIVSGLSKNVIVVEARLKSGSLITADFALEQGRDIYAIPGRALDPLSEGCNKLIGQGAGIIYSVDEFMNHLGEFQTKPAVSVKKNNINSVILNKEQLLVYSFFDLYPKSLSQVQVESQIDYLKLVSLVMSLVNLGFLKESFKNNFVICS